MHIVIVPGSNRTGSLSLKLAGKLIADFTAQACSVDLIELALTSEFLEPTAYSTPAPPVSALVKRFLAADGVLFIVPEYNGSYPGILKLFIDMLPYPQGFDQRPCAFIGVSAGQFQGLRAVEHLQAVAGYRNALIYPGRVFIGDSKRLFDAHGEFQQADLASRLTQQAGGFVHFVSRFKPAGQSPPA